MTSYENESERFLKACESRDRLKEMGISVSVISANIFSFRRNSEKAHFFFIDLEGICACADIPLRFAEMIRRNTLREGDTLFIASYLGRNIGWKRLFRTFDAQFRLLALATPTEKRLAYKRAHPSFTLFSALEKADFQDEISIKCIGCIEYYDSSPMGIYGYVIESGTTSFRKFVRETAYFNIKSGLNNLQSESN